MCSDVLGVILTTGNHDCMTLHIAKLTFLQNFTIHLRITHIFFLKY